MTTENLLKTLDQWEVRFIADFMSPFSQKVLRTTCRYGRAVVIAPEKMKLLIMTKFAAEYGDSDIFALAVKWGTRAHMDITKSKYFVGDNSSGYMSILEIAALNGHQDICIIAMEWFDARERIAREKNAGKGAEYYGGYLSHAEYIDALLNHALSAAARGTDSVRAHDICVLIMEWLCDENITPDLNQMLQAAAESGHCNLCFLARDWAADFSVPLNLSRLLSSATRSGSMEMCILATDWCDEISIPVNKYDLDIAILNAAGCEDVVRARELCIFMRDWVAESKSCSLTHPCSGTLEGLDYNWMIYGAACDPSHYEICVLAHKWAKAEGVRSDFDGVFSLSKGERDFYISREVDAKYYNCVYKPCMVIPLRNI